ncbi:hypothetical protein HDV05_007067 [Chytridiales sp. JEL 0842]|nr:hypothetical protein HDV05_007067 [Chytridiales sp. JEL 0842]
MPVDATLIVPAIAGTLGCLQGCCSAKMASIGGRGFTSFVTIVISSAIGTVLFLVMQWAGVQGLTADLDLGRRDTPWFAYLGGFLNVYYVASMVTLVPKLGVASFYLISILCQLGSAVLLDHFEIMLPFRRATPGRLGGLAIGIIGVLVMNAEALGLKKGIARAFVKKSGNDNMENLPGDVQKSAKRIDSEMTMTDTMIDSPSDEVILEKPTEASQKASKMQESVVVSDTLKSSTISIEDHTTIPSVPSSPTTPTRTTSNLKSLLITPLSGISLALLAGMNSKLGQTYHNPLFASFFALITSLPLMGAFYYYIEYWHAPTDFRKVWRTAPWWSWLGGVFGAFYVVSVAVLSGHLSAGTFLGTSVACQATTAVIVDHFGVMNMPVRLATVERVVGASMLVGGVGMMAFL